ncbi:hypothetical protein CASFOL_036528 [Castilleja foliolosa]|uniref:Uncharacterized protein n=1 Tax=Castilleja foliolosa TaxID=1961234 RepID=A0ABD3BWY7_9LAMI
MATRLFYSIAIIIIISAGFVLLALLQLPAPPEPMDKGLLKFLLDCFNRPINNDGAFKSGADRTAEILCHDTFRLIGHEYESSGRLSMAYVEALRIYHNYNQTDVDIFICGLDSKRCPHRIKALKQLLTSKEMKQYELRRR